MNISTAITFGRWTRWNGFLGSIFAISLMASVFAMSQHTNPGAVDLVTAGTYGALAYSGITGSATVYGDIGTTTAAIGVGITTTGTDWGVGGVHNSDAQSDLNSALIDVGGRTFDETITADALGGLVLGRGVYSGGALDLATGTTLTLNGSVTDIFIIRASSSLTINTNSTISLVGGVIWNNVYWYVGTSATIFSGSIFNGIILAGSSITVNTGATSMTGKLLATTGAVTINSDVLPVELVAFTASVNQKNVNLNWTTATEVNNFGFDIERSESAEWEKIGFVDGAGTTNAPKQYSFFDTNLPSGRYLFRLKQIDRDGKFSYSHSAEATISQVPNGFVLVQNYPNPFNPTTMINYQLPSSSHVSLKVFNAIGKEITTLVSEVQEAGNYAVPFTLSANTITTLSSGVYFYRLEAGSFVSTKKLIILK